MYEIKGWYSVGANEFVVCEEPDKPMVVTPEVFEVVSEKVADDQLDGKCVVKPFIAPKCAGWHAKYNKE